MLFHVEVLHTALAKDTWLLEVQQNKCCCGRSHDEHDDDDDDDDSDRASDHGYHPDRRDHEPDMVMLVTNTPLPPLQL